MLTPWFLALVSLLCCWFFRLKWKWKKEAHCASDLVGTPAVISLLPLETSITVMSQPSITTITFFEGDREAAVAFLRQKVKEMVQKNPWLAGRLTRQRGDVVLVYNKCAADNVLGLIQQSSMTLSRDMTYVDIATSLGNNSMDVKKGIECMDQNENLFKVTVATATPGPGLRKEFAVVVSLSHIIGDGHTFYQLHNMLSNKLEVGALQIQRKQELAQAITDAMGGRLEAGAVCAPCFGFMANFAAGAILSKLIGPSTMAAMHYVHADWVLEQKRAAKGVEATEWVSTNDIITSVFSRVSGVDVCMMAINFRNKIAGAEESMAGNYQNVLTLNKADFASPALVRRAVATLKRAAEPPTELLTSWGWLGACFAACTNWSTFTETLVVPRCTQVLHFPIFDFSMSTPARVSCACIIFRPSPGKLAVLVAGSPRVLGRVRNSSLLGEAVAIKME